MQFLSVELHGSILESCSTKFLCQSIKGDKLECIFTLVWMLLGFCRCWFAGTIHHAIGF